ncbi:hypothetical protein B0H12DRAFT_1238465 [Mycena haematopus]|nr:hypothetical protein B0H12DRAFT_1238465 [Mycena haematopus]
MTLHTTRLALTSAPPRTRIRMLATSHHPPSRVTSTPALLPARDKGLACASGKMLLLDGELFRRGYKVLMYRQFTMRWAHVPSLLRTSPLLFLPESPPSLNGRLPLLITARTRRLGPSTWKAGGSGASTIRRRPLERRDQMNEFQTAGAPPLFLLSTRSGGLGVRRIPFIISYDQDWNPQMDTWPPDRVHRIG